MALAATQALAQPAAAPGSGVAGSMSSSIQTPAARLSAALSQIGLTTCAASVQRAAGFLFEDGEANFTVQPLGPDPNRWPTVIVIEGAHAAMGKTRLTTLTVSPGPTCSGFYEQVIWWPAPCNTLKSTVFAAFAPPRLLLREIQVSELNAAVQLYLEPAGTGCTSVKKEMFH